MSIQEQNGPAPLPRQRLSGLEQPDDLTFQWETYGVVFKQMAPLLHAHWQESEPHPDVAPYDPDFDLYFNMERQGAFRIFTVRRGDLILGFNSFMVTTTPSRRAIITALSDILYIRPSERGGLLVMKLILKPEPDLAKQARFIRYTPTTEHDLRPFLLRAHYACKGGNYEKVME